MQVRLHLLDSGSIEPSALLRSCDTLRARSAIACLRSAVTTRARSDSVRCRFLIAIAACDRKCSTSSVLNGLSCSAWRAAILTADQAVPCDQRHAEHGRFADVLSSRRVTAVVVEHRRQRANRLIAPLAPALVLPIETVHAFRLQQCRGRLAHRYPEADPLALGLGPGDLFRDDAQRRFVLLPDQQRRRVIVEREGTMPSRIW